MLQNVVLLKGNVNYTTFYLEHGKVTIATRWHESNEIYIKDSAGETKIETWEYPSRGFYYEMKEVQECVRQNKLESDHMTLNFSLTMMKTLDRIRKIIGLNYPADIETI